MKKTNLNCLNKQLLKMFKLLVWFLLVFLLEEITKVSMRGS